MTTNDAPPAESATSAPVTHYLLSMTTRGMPIAGDQLAIALRDCFESLGVAPLAATSYTSPYHAEPRDLALKDTWLVLSLEEQGELRRRFPHLVTAIELLCGIRKEDYR